MSDQDARDHFNKAIARTNDADKIARLELLREYFTNPDFRKALEDHSFEQTCAAAPTA